MVCCMGVFFFKQKTAYEMRISDWSSDVCSSDLRVDVEAAVGLVEDREPGVDDPHLHHLVALLLAARKADVHGTLEHVHVHLEQPRLLARQLQEIAARQRFLSTRLALRIERFAQELDVRHAGDFDRILEAKEQASSGAPVRFEGEKDRKSTRLNSSH